MKDISKMPPEEQERILALSTQSDRPSSLSINQMRELKEKQRMRQQITMQQPQDQIQLVVTTLPDGENAQDTCQEITLEQR